MIQTSSLAISDAPAVNPSPLLDILRIEDVFKIYKEAEVETVALRGASLRIMTGEFVALLGRSGSGKSTLLNLVAGVDSPSAGKIWIGGQDMTRLAPDAQALLRRQHLGFVFQTNNLIPFLSARENVELPMHLNKTNSGEARKRASELLVRVGLANRQDHKPNQLSGGEAQRVGIACALANRPSLVLADELTGELDSVTTSSILDLMETIYREDRTAFLVVTHNREVAARAQRVVHIQDGMIEAGAAA